MISMHRYSQRHGRVLALAGAILALLWSADACWAQTEGQDAITACFEGPAAKEAEKGAGSDGLARSLLEMKAGALCEPVAEQVIRECLTRMDQTDEEVRNSYECIGLAANPCIDSAWATSEFRNVVCIGTEEKTWLAILHDSLERLKAALGSEVKDNITAMEKHFFEYRNAKCKLIRTLREGSEPLIAYGACTTETAARFAIDLREMLQIAGAAGQEEDREEPNEKSPPPDSGKKQDQSSERDESALGSKLKPVRADNPSGEEAYLKRLRCPGGAAPAFSRQGSMGYGGYGNIVDLYQLRCPNSGEDRAIYMDMYHRGYVETRPVPGFTLAGE